MITTVLYWGKSYNSHTKNFDITKNSICSCGSMLNILRYVFQMFESLLFLILHET